MKWLSSYFDKRFIAEENQQIIKITLACNLLAVLFLGFFAGLAETTGDTDYALILLGVMGGGLLNILVFLKTGNVRAFVVATGVGYFLFCIYLQVNGGQNRTGILWHYVYPVTIFYLAGLRWGLIAVASLIGIDVFLMTYESFPFSHTHYPLEFKIRFIATMMVVSTFGALLEHSREKAQRKLARMAKTFHLASQLDDLTGLANRRAIKEKLEDETTVAADGKKDFMIILCDIDDFKKVNDRYGHNVGDQVLKHLSRHFQRLLRKHDVVSRWGGEEFLFLLPNTNPREGIAVAERIREEVERSPFRLDGDVEIRVTVSCGISNWNAHQNLDALINAADAKLYQAKQDGRNRVIWNV